MPTGRNFPTLQAPGCHPEPPGRAAEACGGEILHHGGIDEPPGRRHHCQQCFQVPGAAIGAECGRRRLYRETRPRGLARAEPLGSWTCDPTMHPLPTSGIQEEDKRHWLENWVDSRAGPGFSERQPPCQARLLHPLRDVPCSDTLLCRSATDAAGGPPPIEGIYWWARAARPSVCPLSLQGSRIA